MRLSPCLRTFSTLILYGKRIFLSSVENDSDCSVAETEHHPGVCRRGKLICTSIITSELINKHKIINLLSRTMRWCILFNYINNNVILSIVSQMRHTKCGFPHMFSMHWNIRDEQTETHCVGPVVFNCIYRWLNWLFPGRRRTKIAARGL